ncbi:MAG: radical SAM family heme chaperone HemW [Balneolaceae bacterium]|nr:MAG: radical SAM family heme chaperone HemW [Balneolaceae bacterium]
MAGLYIHIPFCKQACSYCDFYFVTRRNLLPDFVDALVNEIRHNRESLFTGETIQTIYLGGGTPSLLTGNQLERIFSSLHDIFRIEPLEITMELNPDDVSVDYLNTIKNLGITRASIGIQSFRPELLSFMHRAHSKDDAIRVLELIRKCNFPDFTADLIYGNPGQTVEMLQEDIEQLLVFDPPHISAYSLTIEPKTRLGKQVELGRIKPPDDEQVSDHFECLRNMLEHAGLEQYEVSNFSKPGREALHNSNYWNHHNYLGLGPAAHSFRWKGDFAERWVNSPDIKTYLEKKPGDYRTDPELLQLEQLAEERLMLGLRTRMGVDISTLAHRYNYKLSESQKYWIKNQEAGGTMIIQNGVLKLTPQGLKICDMLVVDLLSKR